MPHRDTSNPDALLQLICTRALLLTKGSGAAIALREHGAMVCQASMGASAPPVGCRLDVASGFSGECVRSARALRCDDSDTDPRVDSGICRELGIRSILAAPIFSEAEVVGLLEVFSPEPFAFDDECLALLDRLARNTIPDPRAARTTSPPKLILELEPAHRVFLRNLADMLFPPRVAPMKLTSLPARFWADVFVPSRLPWKQFYQSMLLHVIMIAALASAVEIWQFQRNSLRPLRLNQADVIYFSPDEYRQALRSSRTLPPLPRGRENGSVKPSGYVVTRESRAQTAVSAPDIRLKPELRSLHLLSWNLIAPTQPITASAPLRRGFGMAPVSVVAPPPELAQAYGNRTAAVVSPVGVVGPPPGISGIASARTLAAPPTGVIGPPPSVHQIVGQAGTINIGRVEAVGPAPQISGHESAMLAGIQQASLHAPVSSIVPPPPAVGGSTNPGMRRMAALSTAVPAALPPAIMRGSYPDKIAGPVAPKSDLGPSPEAAAGSVASAANNKELSVNFVGLALTLPSSSYFASHEVFIAEDRVSRDQSRLIKLVYEFLPYQPRLSEYGPNYPAVDKLRVTRDPECDEPLMQVVASANTAAHPMSDRLRQDLKSLNRQASTLQCYRTTADDYRKAQRGRR